MSSNSSFYRSDIRYYVRWWNGRGRALTELVHDPCSLSENCTQRLVQSGLAWFWFVDSLLILVQPRLSLTLPSPAQRADESTNYEYTQLCTLLVKHNAAALHHRLFHGGTSTSNSPFSPKPVSIHHIKLLLDLRFPAWIYG